MSREKSHDQKPETIGKDEAQKEPNRPQDNRMRTIKLRLGFFGYEKKTKVYTLDGQLAKITEENQPGKTLWDWLQLLIIPIIIAGATIGFGLWQAHLADLQHQSDQVLAQRQHDADQKQALDQQRATILQTYLDNIQDLLIHDNLRGSKLGDEVAILARARTLTALQGLDPQRKGVLVQFLYEANLIGYYSDQFGQNIHPPVILLFGANLTGANLAGAPLSGADLIDTDLSGANLAEADLSGAALDKAYLSGADLRDAHLSGVDLSGADLKSADLSGVDLSGADLSGADLFDVDLGGANITQRQLDQVDSCFYAILPNGLTCRQPRAILVQAPIIIAG
jgi:uncharacterized protein YjbI with pentapeptide repeats